MRRSAVDCRSRMTALFAGRRCGTCPVRPSDGGLWGRRWSPAADRSGETGGRRCGGCYLSRVPRRRDRAEQEEGMLAGAVERVGTGVGVSVLGDQQVGWGGESGDGDAPVRVGQIAVRGDGQGREPFGVVLLKVDGDVAADLVEAVGAQRRAVVEEEQQLRGDGELNDAGAAGEVGEVTVEGVVQPDRRRCGRRARAPHGAASLCGSAAPDADVGVWMMV